jgi:hypothetical protein
MHTTNGAVPGISWCCQPVYADPTTSAVVTSTITESAGSYNAGN